MDCFFQIPLSLQHTSLQDASYTAVFVTLALYGLFYLAFIFNKCSDFKETLLIFFVTRYSL